MIRVYIREKSGVSGIVEVDIENNAETIQHAIHYVLEEQSLNARVAMALVPK